MTYGENTDALREQLTALLRQHRVQQRLGGAGNGRHRETTTVEERQAMGAQIARYRNSILAWCVEAADTALTRLDPLAGTYKQAHHPAESLRRCLHRALQHASADLPELAELTTPNNSALVETWRQAARAASLGEHDLEPPTRRDLSRAQAETVVADVAAISEALALLDLRHHNIPGWHCLFQRGRLARAAGECTLATQNDTLDPSIDRTGWQPTPGRIQGPARPGILGVLQAEHNLWLALTRFPNALNLRRVLESQRLVSTTTAAAATAGAPPLAARWARRAATFTALVDHTHNLGGLIGNGGQAAADGAAAARRASRLVPHAPLSHPALDALRALDLLFDRIDTRLAEAITHGVTHELYLVREQLPHLAARPRGMTTPAATLYVPVATPTHREPLMTLVEQRLRPPPPAPAPPPDAGLRSRKHLREALDAQPPSTRPALGL